MKSSLLIFVFIIVSLSIQAQQIISQKAPFFYQLNSNEIWDFYQDKEGYLWIGTTNGLVRYDGFRLQSFKTNHKQPDLLTNNSIVCMSDNDLYLWIGTRKGLNLFDKKTYRLSPFPDKVLQDKSIDAILMDKDGNALVAAEGKIYKCSHNVSIVKEYILSASGINSMYKDRIGNIWVLISGKGLFRYDERSDGFINYPPIGKENRPFTMFQDKNDNYWIGTWGDGLWQFFPDNSTGLLYKRHHIISSKRKESDPIFYSLTQDDTFGYIWALSHNELYALKITDNGSLEKIDIHDLVDTYMMYTRIFKDSAGNLWLSSYDMAYTLFFDNSKIKNYPLPQIKERMGWDANIIDLCLDNDNIMWLNQDRYGLMLYDPSTNRISNNQVKNDIASLSIRTITICKKDKGVWIGTNGESRVIKLIHKNLNILKEKDIRLRDLTDNPGYILQLEEDEQGNLWILTSTGIFLKSIGSDTLTKIERKLADISKLTIDTHGKVWGISADGNIYQLNYTNDSIKDELYARIPSLSKNEEINHFCVDKKSCIWIVTSFNRIYKFSENKKFEEDSLLSSQTNNSSVLSLQADNNYLWIVTNKKVIRYDINNGTSYNYQASDDNIVVNVFRNKAVALDQDGGIYVGGHGGFTHILPPSHSPVSIEEIAPVISDIKVNNQSLFFSDSIKNNQRNTINKIFLNAQDRNIEILFSALQYSLNSKERLAYKLEGVDMDWVYLDSDKQSAFYNHLSKGNYKLRLKAEYTPGKWTEDKVVLIIEKEAAFYETWYAYLFYVILIIVCIYTVLRLYLLRVRRKDKTRLQEELAQTKLDYFTNVSHELLTPLTIMSSAVDYLEIKASSNENQVNILKSNISRLKRLIQQVLDFRRIDIEKMPLTINYGNIGLFILNICQTNFSALAKKKNIDLKIHVPTDEIWGYTDFEKVDKILFNLLSNAVKYTPSGGNIIVTVKLSAEKDNTLIVQIEDTGVGIAENDLDNIFSRFYQNKANKNFESNGIGLSLTKSLVTLLHGNIFAENNSDKGSCFTINLPIDKRSYHPEEVTTNILKTSESKAMVSNISLVENENIPTLLLVDDNTELLFLMKKTLENRFNVITAQNAILAWEHLNNYAVDIIVCDVMMPDISGWELCRQIKTDLRYNHIPIIILTARNGDEDRITSYEVGAEGYIAKPFELKELISQVNNLTRLYKTRQEVFQKEQNTNIDGLSYESANKRFLQSTIQQIEIHIERSDFDLDELSSALNMSKSTLHRKIKSITGLTPLDFIRNIKMKKACMMLLDGRLTISEVAYALGFNDPKYFSKCFKNEFGATPSEYQQKCIK